MRDALEYCCRAGGGRRPRSAQDAGLAREDSVRPRITKNTGWGTAASTTSRDAASAKSDAAHGANKVDIEFGDPRIGEVVRAVCADVAREGGRAFLVGGCVRDAALGRQPQDADIEVFGVPAARLQALVGARFAVDLVGEAFGVLKIHGVPVDVSLPRRESKSGLGHKGFTVFSDPDLAYEEAAARRDFTINAMSFDPLGGALIDPFGGMRDLAGGVLRHTSPRFAEDPLRVLRGMQFAARFDFGVAPATVVLCRAIEPEGLARERIFAEWKKLVVDGARPSRGLAFLDECGWVRYYPELAAMIECPQEPDWHPEGDVWVHTLHCMDAFAGERLGDPYEDLVVGFGVLCHDFGKPPTTAYEGGRIRSRGHERAGEEPTRAFLGRMTGQTDLIEDVVALVAHHLRPQQLHYARAGDSAIRRLARSVRRIDRLVRVARADRAGRPGHPDDAFPEGDWLLAEARRLAVADAAPAPLVLGRHLIALGLEPGPHFGPILDACYEAQLDGEFATVEDGIAFAERWIR